MPTTFWSEEGGDVKDKLRQGERSQAEGLEEEKAVADGTELLPVALLRPRSLPRMELEALLVALLHSLASNPPQLPFCLG